ncbi:MAG: tetratricopeptide repeat protein [Myxococcota bacterium]
MAYVHRDHPSHEGYSEATEAYEVALATSGDREAAYREALTTMESEHGSYSAQAGAAHYYLASYLGSVDRERATPVWAALLEIEIARYGEMHPETAGTLNNLGLHFKRLGNVDALEILTRWSAEIHRKTDGDWSTAWWNLGISLEQEGQRWRGLAVLRRVGREAPNAHRAKAWHAMGQAAKSLGLAEMATHAFSEMEKTISLEENPRERCNALHNHGLFLGRVERYDDAIETLRRAAAEERAHFGVGDSLRTTLRVQMRTLLRAGRFDEAIELADGALAEDPEHSTLEVLRTRAAAKETLEPPSPLEPQEPEATRLWQTWEAAPEDERATVAGQLRSRAPTVELQRLYAELHLDTDPNAAAAMLDDEDEIVRYVAACRLQRFDLLREWLKGFQTKLR